MAESKREVAEWKKRNKNKKRKDKEKKPKELKPLRRDNEGKPLVVTSQYVAWLEGEVEKMGAQLWVLLGQKDRSRQSINVKAALAIDLSE